MAEKVAWRIRTGGVSVSEQITIPPGVNLRRFAGKGHSDLPRRNTPAKQLFGAGCLSWRRLAQLAQRFHPWHVQGRSFHVALCVHSQSWADNVQVNFAALPKLHFQDLEKKLHYTEVRFTSVVAPDRENSKCV